MSAFVCVFMHSISLKHGRVKLRVCVCVCGKKESTHVNADKTYRQYICMYMYAMTGAAGWGDLTGGWITKSC